MYFQVRQLVLWPRNPNLGPRVVAFEIRDRRRERDHRGVEDGQIGRHPTH